MIESPPRLIPPRVGITSPHAELTWPTVHHTWFPASDPLLESEAIEFELEVADGEFIASEPRTGTYGEGDTELAAVESLFRSLIDLRSELRDRRERLAPELAADLEFLERILWA